jgi:hypothetical protein
MAVTVTALAPGVESIHPVVGGDPQIAVVVFQQILNEVGAQAARVVRVVLVHDEAVAVIAIEAVPGGKPHESAPVLQNVDDVALRQAVVGREMSELQVRDPDVTVLDGDTRGDDAGGAGLCGQAT